MSVPRKSTSKFDFVIPDKVFYYTYRCMEFRAIFNFDCVAGDRLKVNCSLKLDFKDGGVLWDLRISFIILLNLHIELSAARLTRSFINKYLLVLLLMCSCRKKFSLV